MKTARVPTLEFIDRLLLHVLPRGLRHIRRFGMWGNQLRTERLARARRLRGARPPEALGQLPATQREEEPEEPLDLDLLRLEAEQGVPRKCRACGGQMERTFSTPRPTVAELMQMPSSMERIVETGPLQLHLPVSAFL